MASESRLVFVALGVLAALFAWSPWAGLAGVAAIACWMLWLAAGDAARKRRWQKTCREQLEQALLARVLELEAVFCGTPGHAALGIAAGGVAFVSLSSEGLKIFGRAAIIEARARRLPQGSYEIGLCVPGRPYWHVVIVGSRAEAERWARRVEPLGKLDLQLGQ